MPVCPVCHKPLRENSNLQNLPEAISRKLSPFCSDRCKKIDLGAWLSETYRVPAATPPDQAIQEGGEPPDHGALE